VALLVLLARRQNAVHIVISKTLLAPKLRTERIAEAVRRVFPQPIL
jgi:hypothetical protein